jgi:hypothetical protein
MLIAYPVAPIDLSQIKYDARCVSPITKSRLIRPLEIFWKPFIIPSHETSDRLVCIKNDEQKAATREKSSQGPGEPNEIFDVTTVDKADKGDESTLAASIKNERVSLSPGIAYQADAAIIGVRLKNVDFEQLQIGIGTIAGGKEFDTRVLAV